MNLLAAAADWDAVPHVVHDADDDDPDKGEHGERQPPADEAQAHQEGNEQHSGTNTAGSAAARGDVERPREPEPEPDPHNTVILLGFAVMEKRSAHVMDR